MLEMISLCKEDRPKYERKMKIQSRKAWWRACGKWAGRHDTKLKKTTLEPLEGVRWKPRSRQPCWSRLGRGESTVRQQPWKMCQRSYKNKRSKTWPMTGLRIKGNGGVHDNYAAPSQANCRNDKNNTRNGPLPVLLLKKSDGNLFST